MFILGGQVGRKHTAYVLPTGIIRTRFRGSGISLTAIAINGNSGPLRYIIEHDQTGADDMKLSSVPCLKKVPCLRVKISCG